MHNQDELRELWSSQPSCGQTKGDELVMRIQKKTRHFDRMIVARNLIECIAAFVVMGLFVVYAIRAPNTLERTGCLVVAAGAVWIAFYVLRYGKGAPGVDPSQSFTGYSRALLDRYDYQIQLLRSVKYWYLLPLYIGLLIISAGRVLDRASSGSLGWQDLAGPAFYTAVFLLIWWLNEVHAVKRLGKERAKLLSMTTENDPSDEAERSCT